MKKKNLIRNLTNISFIILIITQLLLFYIRRIIGDYYVLLYIPYIVFILLSCLYCYKNKKIDKRIYFYLILSLALFIRVIFIIKMPYLNFQTDFGTIGTHETVDYIYTIFKTNALPLTNIRQFYHPPLFYFICAVLTRFNTALGISTNTNIESFKIVSASLSMLSLYYIYKIINKIKINDRSKLLLFCLMCFHPSMILISIHINTDSLVTMFAYMIIYYLIEWNEKPNIKNTIILALVTGLCVMSKYNGALLAVPILFVFINKLIKEKSKIKSYFSKYILFGIISLPLGLWYEIRNIILFGRNKLLDPNNMRIYTGNYSIIDRFIKIDIDSLIRTVCVMPIDYNVPSYVIKSSLFGQHNYNVIDISFRLLLIIGIVCIIITLICIFNYIFRRKNKDFIINMFLVLYFTYIIGFIIYNLYLPYACTMGFRYIVITLFPSLVVLIYETEKCKNKWIKKIIYSCLLLFVMASIFWIIRL